MRSLTDKHMKKLLGWLSTSQMSEENATVAQQMKFLAITCAHLKIAQSHMGKHPSRINYFLI